MLATTLLKIRFLQFRRELKGLGWWHKVLFTAMLFALISVIHQAYKQFPGCFYALGFLWAGALAAQFFRPDKQFLFLHLAKPKQALFLEYFGLSLPLILPALLTQHWYCLLLFPAGLFPITFIKTSISVKTRFVFLGQILPPTAFEWIAGFRQNLWLLIPVYFLALAFCWVKILPIALLWLLFGLLLGVYQVTEPILLLRAIAQDPNAIINHKIREMGKLLLILSLPVLLLQTIFYPWLGLAGLAFLVLQFCVLTFAILLKYSAYQPNQAQHSNMLLLAFAQLSVVLPFFLLLPLVLVFRQYRRATFNLQLYLP